MRGSNVLVLSFVGALLSACTSGSAGDGDATAAASSNAEDATTTTASSGGVDATTQGTGTSTDGGITTGADVTGTASGSTTADVDVGSVPGDWPGPDNTGVPRGTRLTPYDGPCTIDVDGTVIDAKTVSCDLVIHAADVVIQNSMIQGLVFLDTDLEGSSAWSFTLQDSEVDGGAQQRAVVSAGNMTVLRANIHGGITAVQCEEKSVSCHVEDSWLHGQYLPDDQPWHLGGFLSDGGHNMRLIHNNIICDHPVNSLGEGCTGDLNLIPNFATISDVVIEYNFFGANEGSAYCTYGGERSDSPYPHADHVAYRHNVWERGTNGTCAAYGPVTSFNVDGEGNEWVDNTWEDGEEVPPEN